MEQVKAVRYLTQSSSSVRILTGYAGTGKTYALRTCVDIWKRKGYRVVGTAHTGQAAEVLEAGTGIPCTTLTRFLGDYRLSAATQAKHHARQLARAAKKRRTYRFKQPRPQKIDDGTIVLVDEASMINTRQMEKLAAYVGSRGATLCLVGDPAQLPAVEGGSPFLSMAHRLGHVTMEDIRRQKEPWARQAAKLFATGAVGPALAMYARHKQVQTRETAEEAMQQMCLDWTAHGLITPEKAIILTNTNEESEEANRLCQKHRLNARTIKSNKWLEVVDVGDGKGTIYRNRVHVGERVLFTKNSNGRSGYGVNNGSLGKVISIDGLERVLYVRLDNGDLVDIPVRKYKHIRLGYAATTHRSQGSTIPHVQVLATGSEMQNMAASYVQATRGSDDTVFYTTHAMLDESLEDVENSRLAESMSRQIDLTLASDLLEGDTTAETVRRKEISRLVETWDEKFVFHPEEALIVAGSRQDADMLNRQVARRREVYAINGHLPRLSFEGKTYAEGDRIRFLKPSLGLGIQGREIGVIVGIDAKQECLYIRTSRGRDVHLHLGSYSHIEHAYAVTRQEADGVKVGHALILRDGSESKAPSIEEEALSKQSSESMNRQRSAMPEAVKVEYFGDLQYAHLAEEPRSEVKHVYNTSSEPGSVARPWSLDPVVPESSSSRRRTSNRPRRCGNTRKTLCPVSRCRRRRSSRRPIRKRIRLLLKNLRRSPACRVVVPNPRRLADPNRNPRAIRRNVFHHRHGRRMSHTRALLRTNPP